jgi:TAT (twin-arginine translocation) pathway-exported protein
MVSLNRRRFLKTSAALGGALSIAAAKPHKAHSGKPRQNRSEMLTVLTMYKHGARQSIPAFRGRT